MLECSAPAGGVVLWNCGILGSGAWLKPMTSWKLVLESKRPAMPLAEFSLPCDLQKSTNSYCYGLSPSSHYAFPARTLLFSLNCDLNQALFSLNHLCCLFWTMPFNLISIPTDPNPCLQICWPQIGSKENSNDLESSWWIRGDYPQVSKTMCPWVPVLRQSSKSEYFPPSDPDSKLVSTVSLLCRWGAPWDQCAAPNSKCLHSSLSQTICFYHLLSSGSRGRCPHSLGRKEVDCLSVLPSFYQGEKLITDTGI